MIRRLTPTSDDQRTQALDVCHRRAAGMAEGQRLITQEQFDAVAAALEPWREVRGLAGSALAGQAAATEACDAAFDAAVTAVAHFIHVLNMAIRRRRLEPTDRVGYGLPASRARLPLMNTTADVLLWAERLEAGEATRVAAGGLPLAWPDIGEVTAAAAELHSCEMTLSTAKYAYDKAQEAVAKQRPAVQALIKDVWDTVEFSLRKHDAPSRRRAARDWGVVYATRPANKRPAPAATPAQAGEQGR